MTAELLSVGLNDENSTVVEFKNADFKLDEGWLYIWAGENQTGLTPPIYLSSTYVRFVKVYQTLP